MSTPRLGTAIGTHALLRILSSAGALLVGLDLAHAAHAPVLWAGWLGAASYAAELASALPLGVAADALPVRWLMCAGALASGAALQLFESTDSLSAWLASRLLAGIGVAALTPPLLQLLAWHTRDERARRARLMSFFELSMLGGLALGGLAAGQLWARLGPQAFSLCAALCALSAPVLWLAAGPGSAPGASAALAGLRRALADPSVRELTPAWLCVNAVVGLWLGPTFTYLLTEHDAHGQYLDGLFAADPSAVGYLLLAYAGVFGTGVLLWSGVLTRVSALATLRVSLAAMLAVCAALFVWNHCGTCSLPARWLIGTATAALIMVESGFTPAALTWLAGALRVQSGRGAAMGIYSVLFSLGALGGSLPSGWLAQRWGVDGLLAGTALLALGALAWLPRRGSLPALALDP